MINKKRLELEMLLEMQAFEAEMNADSEEED